MDSYRKCTSCLREIKALAERARGLFARRADDAEDRVTRLKPELVAHVKRLADLWPDTLDKAALVNLKRHVSFSEESDYNDIVAKDVPALEDALLGFLEAQLAQSQPVGFRDLLHPDIMRHALAPYENRHYREAVLNGMLALTEAIRERTGADLDGAPLVNDAFRPDGPKLEFSARKTQSDRDDHDGFHKIMLGAFQGIRNPKAHSLATDLTAESAAQYLIFLSLLLRRIDQARDVVQGKEVAEGRLRRSAAAPKSRSKARNTQA